MSFVTCVTVSPEGNHIVSASDGSAMRCIVPFRFSCIRWRYRIILSLHRIERLCKDIKQLSKSGGPAQVACTTTYIFHAYCVFTLLKVHACSVRGT